MDARLRIVLADDHALLREAFARLLQDRFDVVGTAGTGVELLERVRDLRPDVALVDVLMPRMNGIDACLAIRRDHPGTRVVMLTVETDPRMAAHAFAAGASGFVVKSATGDELGRAIRSAAENGRFLSREISGGDPGALPPHRSSSGWSALSPREREVVELVAEGLTMKEVAVRLGLGRRTVEFYKYQAMKTLGISSTGELIRSVLERKLC
jgi:DNA-binding NarL/FixJ family response regulator